MRYRCGSNDIRHEDPMDDSIRAALSRGGVIDITTIGRRTGEPRRIEIVFHRIDGRIWISGLPSPRGRGWIANLSADPRLTVHLKGPAVVADLAATARIVDDPTERRVVLERVAQAWRRTDIDVMVATSPLIEVTIDEPAATRSASDVEGTAAAPLA
jgi:deazaflavin-dependent oxidoreductase (nitroreductase family)